MEVASLHGTATYQDLMGEWFSLCTRDDESGRTLYPLPDLNRLRNVQHSWSVFLDNRHLSWLEKAQYRLGWKRRDVEKVLDLDFFVDDHATEVLTELLIGAADKHLAENGDETINKRPYVVMALPNWFFKNEVISFDNPAIGASAMTEVSAESAGNFTQRISTALHRAGFRQSAEPDLTEMIHKHHRGERSTGPVPATEAFILQALGGSCAGDLSFFEYCQRKRRNGIACPVVALSIDMIGANLWLPIRVDDSKGYPEHRVWTQYWPIHSTSPTQPLFTAMIDSFTKAARDLSIIIESDDCPIEVLLRSTGWSETSMDNLQTAVSGSKLQIRPRRVL